MVEQTFLFQTWLLITHSKWAIDNFLVLQVYMTAIFCFDTFLSSLLFHLGRLEQYTEKCQLLQTA